LSGISQANAATKAKTSNPLIFLVERAKKGERKIECDQAKKEHLYFADAQNKLQIFPVDKFRGLFPAKRGLKPCPLGRKTKTKCLKANEKEPWNFWNFRCAFNLVSFGKYAVFGDAILVDRLFPNIQSKPQLQ